VVDATPSVADVKADEPPRTAEEEATEAARVRAEEAMQQRITSQTERLAAEDDEAREVRAAADAEAARAAAASAAAANRKEAAERPPPRTPAQRAAAIAARTQRRAAEMASAMALANSGTVSLDFGLGAVKVPGKILLFAVAGLWGSFSPLVRVLYAQEHAPSPELFNAERLLLSSAVFVPSLWGEFKSWQEEREVKALTDDQASDSKASKTSSDAEAKDAEGGEEILDVAAAAEKALAVPPPASEPRWSFVRAGIELGTWVFLANVTQVLGLDVTSASQAAFLNQLQTVIVPVLAVTTGLQAVSGCNWASSAIALAGVALLSLDNVEVLSTLNGDGLEVLSAVFFSIYILRLSQFSRRMHVPPLVGTKVFAQAALSIAWVASAAYLTPPEEMAASYAPGGRIVPSVGFLGSEWLAGEVAVNIAVVVWTGLFVSALSGYLQARGQAAVKPSDAAVIFASQPLFAAALSALTLGEGFGPDAIAGGFFILGAAALSSADPKPKAKRPDVPTLKPRSKEEIARDAAAAEEKSD